ncbi:ppsC [Symbiodinium sp. CCMP2592]|nr:ppsC [Symbiodinium sp. CCMP2592]
MIDCLLARLIYGYLVIYTETRQFLRFWVTQLGHMHLALVLYVILMVGVLQLRSDEPAPGIIAACSLVFVLWSAIRFRQQYRWQRLPFKEVAFVAEETLDQQKDEGRGEGELSAKCYVQPELRAAESLEVEATMP